MSRRRLTLTLGLATPALVLAPLPAFAEVHTVKDAAHDVVSRDVEEKLPEQLEPNRDEGDALAMRVKHGRKAVRVTLRMARLTRDATTTAVHVVTLRTNEGRQAELYLYVSGRRWQGERMWSVGNRDRRCRGLSTHIDYGTATVRAVIPRRCLSDPRWVQVDAGSGILTEDRLYADDVNLTGTVDGSPTDPASVAADPQTDDPLGATGAPSGPSPTAATGRPGPVTHSSRRCNTPRNAPAQNSRLYLSADR